MIYNRRLGGTIMVAALQDITAPRHIHNEWAALKRIVTLEEFAERIREPNGATRTEAQSHQFFVKHEDRADS